VHIVIMGCGRVGSSLAHRLEEAGHSVAIIDQNPSAFRRLGPEFAGTQVTGIGFDQQTLTRAGIERADAFAAVSSGDNSNIISARVARETFNVDHVVARIYDPKRAAVYERLGIPTIATVPWTTEEMLRAIIGSDHSEHWRDPTGKVVLAQVDVHESWVGHRLSELEAVAGARVVFLTRFGEAMLPGPQTVVQQGDLVAVAMTDDMAESVRRAAAEPPEGSH
jgi:trk system potassium uptake protein TrkA